MDAEVWRAVSRDPRYLVSDMGRVVGQRGWVMSPIKGGSEHVKVQLGRGKGVYVHTLVLEAFVGPCPPGMECRHRDGVPTNNNLWNLEWNTRPVNTKDRKAHGQLNACHRLSTEDASEIKKLLAEGVLNMEAIGRQFGCTGQNVRRIKNGEIHK